MGRVDENRYSKARPKITQEDIEGGDFAVVTIVKFDEAPVTRKEVKEPEVTPFLLTEEYGDKVLWLNKTMVVTLIDKFGNESDRWVGKRVPIVKATVNFGTESFKKVVVAEPEEWDDLLSLATDGEPVKRPRKAAKVGKRSAGKTPPKARKRGK